LIARDLAISAQEADSLGCSLQETSCGSGAPPGGERAPGTQPAEINLSEDGPAIAGETDSCSGLGPANPLTV